MRIRKYIFTSLIKVFAGTLAVLFCVMLIIQWVSIGVALTLKDIDTLLLAMVPMASFVIPMALLFSILLVLERFSIESEIIAMKACGINLSTLYTPVIVLSVCAMVLHISITTYFGPNAMKIVETRLLQSASQKIFSFIKERQFDDSFKDVIIYVESVNPQKKELKNVFIETTGMERSIITSESGTIEVNNNSIILKLINGSVFMDSKIADRYITFGEYLFSLHADFSSELKIKSFDTATQAEFRDLLKRDPSPKLIKEYYNRFSFPVLNLIVGLVGISFGIVKPRSPRFTGFIVGVGTIVGYYLLFTFSDRIVKGKIIDPFIGAWLPDIFFCVVLSIIFLVKKFRFSEGGV